MSTIKQIKVNSVIHDIAVEGANVEGAVAEAGSLTGVTATAAELNYVDGVTSNIQTQLNGKAASNHNHDATNITSGTLSSDRLPTVPIAKGGTGATDVAGATKNLFNPSISTPGYVLTLPATGWTGGYTSVNQLKTTLGVPTFTLNGDKLIITTN